MTLHGVGKETAVSSNASTCLIVRAGHDRRQQSHLVNCKATQESKERKDIYFVSVFGSKLQLKKEVKRPGVSVKLMFFL